MRRLYPPVRFRNQYTGVALIAVLGLISVMMVLALGVLEATKRHGQMTMRSIQSAQAREMADSALRLAILEWSSAEQQPTAYSKQFKIFGSAVEVSLEVESGRVDLNAAGESLLIAMFAANGYELADARRFAARIIDWRDADDSTGVHGGAERIQYRAANRTMSPRNGPFESVGELRMVLGLESVSHELLSGFTVYTHAPHVRRAVASAPVRRALQWMRDGMTDDRMNTTEDPGVSTAGEVSRLRACSRIADVEACREATVRFTGSADEPVLVYAWESVGQT